ncbi:MAG: O-antigen ligase family protein [Chloroflexi bacterium]|nr:O-antigen ligase family protein [Chloroflexota bacterium]
MAAGLDNPPFSTAWQVGNGRRGYLIQNALVLLSTLIVARLVLSIDYAAVYALVLLLAFLAFVAQPRYGLYALFGVCLLFEGAFSSEDVFQAPSFFLTASPQTTLHLSGVVLTPIELFVVLVAAAWLARGAMERRFDFRAGELGAPALFLSIGLGWGILRGLMTNANVNLIFWESRFLVAMIICYILAANLIRKRGHVQSLLSLILVVVGFAGIEGIWRKVALVDAGKLGTVPEFWYAHDDVVMWGLLLLLVFGVFAFGGPRWQRVVGPVLALATAVTMLISERRAGYVAVIIAFVAFSIILFRAKRKSFWRMAVPVIIAGAVYMPIFWNNTGMLGQPARAVRSISDPDPRDASSNAWRDMEAINVRATIQSNPLLGIGFGNRFLQVVTVPDISFFPFWDLEAHHDVLWVWMKTGALGFIAFFGFVLAGVMRGAWMAKHLKDPNFRVFAMLTVCAVVMSMVFSYVDLGLVGNRVPMVLGIMLGALSVLPRIEKEQSTQTELMPTQAIGTRSW